MRFFSIAVAMIVFSLSGLAQTGNGDQKLALKKLQWMIGSWSGTSTVTTENQKRITHIKETVQPSLGGTILLINVRATDADTFTNKQSLAYTSFSVISFDTKKKTYRWTSWRTNGNDYEEENFEVGNQSFDYTSHERGGQVRYKANLDSKGEFLETGEYSTDGATWKEFITMKLLKSKR